ncbi:MAG TPA: asparagine synthase C-terminal domain-containing protein [Allosphingosinicella sp.]|nr:asparagine synthase C-terminal domain-containing protein [Allosphingosinicella sp.]
MKLRFLAVAGSPARLDRIAAGLRHPAAPDLLPLLQRPSLRIWGSSETPHVPLSDDTGLIVGLLFRKVDGQRIETIAPAEQLERTLLDEHWGAYVLLRETGDGHLVLRDPSGAITTYCGACENVHFYASDAAMLQCAWPRPFAPSVDFLRQWLAYPFLRAAMTGDDAITELLPGQRRQAAGPTVALDLAWSPFDHLPPPGPPPSLEQATERLRRAIINCIPRFACPGESVTLQLSGGLDSSIIAGTLAAVGRPFRAITFATRTADGDERRYARLVAEHAGAPLAELVEPDWTPDFERFETGPLRPPPNMMMQPFQRSIALGVLADGTDILIDGGGGDNVLGRISTASPVLDALFQSGAGAAWRTAGELAQLHGCTAWTVLRAALKRARRGRAIPWSADLRFLDRDLNWPAPQPHPWLAPHTGLPHGKADQLAMIVGIRHFLADPAPGMPAAFHPLMAQPLLETCLSLPTWLGMRGGQERAIARRAFRGLLPDAILDRRSKGRFESIFLRNYMASRARLESFLLDGHLARRGLLDARRISAYLRQKGQPRDHDYLRLLEIVPAEQWLRSFGR